MTTPPPIASPPSATARRGCLRRLASLLAAVPRFLLRVVALAWVTLASDLAVVGGGLLLGPRRRHAWNHRVFSAWSRVVGRVLGMRIEVTGTPPRTPYLLVSNHVSYVDIVLLGAAAGGSFVAKQEIDSWPVVGHLCRGVGTVFIDRGAKRDLVRVARAVERAMAAGKGVIVFPEGTTGDGRALLAFKPSLLEVAAAGERPVHWAVVRYATVPPHPPASEAVCWTGGQPLVPHLLHLLAMPGFRAHVHFGGEPVRGDDRKQLARRLREAMAAQLGERP